MYLTLDHRPLVFYDYHKNIYGSFKNFILNVCYVYVFGDMHKRNPR